VAFWGIQRQIESDGIPENAIYNYLPGGGELEQCLKDLATT